MAKSQRVRHSIAAVFLALSGIQSGIASGQALITPSEYQSILRSRAVLEGLEKEGNLNAFEGLKIKIRAHGVDLTADKISKAQYCSRVRTELLNIKKRVDAADLTGSRLAGFAATRTSVYLEAAIRYKLDCSN